jgi:hypothetical protein
MNQNKKQMTYTVAVYCILALMIILGLILGCQQLKGLPGQNGLDGNTPKISTVPATLTECPTGGVEITIDDLSTSVICDGLEGGQGPTGPQGITGLPGTPGAPAPQIQIIQFCPDADPEYPTTFPEIGLRIYGQLYAVYSALGGYLFHVLPGYYASNAIGSSCSFTVNPDGTVTN